MIKSTKALFLCNEKFLDDTLDGGGVKLCTDEFKALIKTNFIIEEFPVTYNQSFLYRVKKKIGISAYEDYDLKQYEAALRKKIGEEKIKYVFLNLSNTAPFAKMVKSIGREVTIILCSHGNESGDFLHETVMHQKYTRLKKKLAFYNLGKMLVNESECRQYIDLVLTVSGVEEELEKWIGAKKIYMVPRIIGQEILEEHIIQGRLGFLSDLSHEPNFYGINELCKAIISTGGEVPEIRLAGGGPERGKLLSEQYNFVEYLGYLPEEALKKELSTWSFALNPVFYYSRGVSTKLGKCLSLGIPVMTTAIGMRGYKWQDGELPFCKTKIEMAEKCIKFSRDAEAIKYYRKEVKKIQASTPEYENMMGDILSLLHN